MAHHVRKQLRDDAVLRLTGLPTTATRVYSGRVRPAAKDASPHLLVYCTEEASVVDAAGADPFMERTVTLAIEGRAVATEAADLEDTLDQIALEVEPVILTSDFSGRVRVVNLTSTRINIEAPGERHVGEIRMEFSVQYRTRESAPDKAL